MKNKDDVLVEMLRGAVESELSFRDHSMGVGLPDDVNVEFGGDNWSVVLQEGKGCLGEVSVSIWINWFRKGILRIEMRQLDESVLKELN